MLLGRWKLERQMKRCLNELKNIFGLVNDDATRIFFNGKEHRFALNFWPRSFVICLEGFPSKQFNFI
jgi:hypothetical protein